jgi:hypothetical protein
MQIESRQEQLKVERRDRQCVGDRQRRCEKAQSPEDRMPIPTIGSARPKPAGKG